MSCRSSTPRVQPGTVHSEESEVFARARSPVRISFSGGNLTRGYNAPRLLAAPDRKSISTGGANGIEDRRSRRHANVRLTAKPARLHLTQ
jgi:hypothetical protein